MTEVALPPPPPDRPMRHKFSKAEDALLRRLVDVHGETDWALIATQIPNRTPRQCRERFHNYISPTLNNGPWTAAEEVLLDAKVREMGPRWAEIARSFHGRSDVNVKNHWTAMLNQRQRVHQAGFDRMLPCYYPQYVPYQPQMYPYMPMTMPVVAPPVFPRPAPVAKPTASRIAVPLQIQVQVPLEVQVQVEIPQEVEVQVPEIPEFPDESTEDHEDFLPFQFENQRDTSYDLFM
jgi:hypothetical protein